MFNNLLERVFFVGSVSDVDVSEFGEVDGRLSMMDIVVDAIEPYFVEAEARMVDGSIHHIVHPQQDDVEQGQSPDQAYPRYLGEQLHKQELHHRVREGADAGHLAHRQVMLLVVFDQSGSFVHDDVHRE